MTIFTVTKSGAIGSYVCGVFSSYEIADAYVGGQTDIHTYTIKPFILDFTEEADYRWLAEESDYLAE